MSWSLYAFSQLREGWKERYFNSADLRPAKSVAGEGENEFRGDQISFPEEWYWGYLLG